MLRRLARDLSFIFFWTVGVPFILGFAARGFIGLFLCGYNVAARL